jgi:hypothetical protein
MKENNQEKKIKRPSSTSFPSPASLAQVLLPPRSACLPGLLACLGRPSPLASARFPAPQRAAQLPWSRPTPLPPCAASSSRPRPNALVHPVPPLVAQRWWRSRRVLEPLGPFVRSASHLQLLPSILAENHRPPTQLYYPSSWRPKP